ncbi:MAG: SHOCT domain-containing protein [Chloroflexi bacterium]|nr:SHOCT domain-containing protein [Chloroflexota bacterium]
MAASGLLGLALVFMLVLVLAVIGLVVWQGGFRAARRPPAPEVLLRARYAQGEITAQRYREALGDVLKDRYVRGEIDLEEYQTRLEHLLSQGRPRLAGERTPEPPDRTRTRHRA